MSSICSENVHFCCMPFDYASVMSVGNKLDEFDAELRALEARRIEYLNIGNRSKLASIYVEAIPYITAFVNRVNDYAKNGGSGVDLTTDRSPVLFTYLSNYYHDNFLNVFTETERSLYTKDGKRVGNFVCYYEQLKLFDNKLTWLLTTGKKLSIPLRDFIGNIVYSNENGDKRFSKSCKSEEREDWFNFMAAALRNEFGCSHSNEYRVDALQNLMELLESPTFVSTSQLETGKICTEISFYRVLSKEGTPVRYALPIKNTNFVSGRRTILRDLLNEVIEFAIRVNPSIRFDLLDLGYTDFTDDLKEAETKSLGINLSCSIIKHEINGSVEYILPYSGTARASLVNVKKILEACGVVLNTITLKFEG